MRQIRNPEINPHIYNQLKFQNLKPLPGKGTISSTNGVGKNRIASLKKYQRPLPYAAYKNQFSVAQGSKPKTSSHQISRRK